MLLRLPDMIPDAPDLRFQKFTLRRIQSDRAFESNSAEVHVVRLKTGKTQHDETSRLRRIEFSHVANAFFEVGLVREVLLLPVTWRRIQRCNSHQMFAPFI